MLIAPALMAPLPAQGSSIDEREHSDVGGEFDELPSSTEPRAGTVADGCTAVLPGHWSLDDWSPDDPCPPSQELVDVTEFTDEDLEALEWDPDGPKYRVDADSLLEDAPQPLITADECQDEYPHDELDDFEYWLVHRREGCLPLGWAHSPDLRCTPQGCAQYDGSIGIAYTITTNSVSNQSAMRVDISFDEVESLFAPDDAPPSGAIIGMRVVCRTPGFDRCDVDGGDWEDRNIHDWENQTKTVTVSVPPGGGAGQDDAHQRVLEIQMRSTWSDDYPDAPPWNETFTDAFGPIPIRCDHGGYQGAGHCSHFTVEPVVTFNVNSTLHSEAAEHIRDALTDPGSTYPHHPGTIIPGAVDSGHPLTRNWYDFNSRERSRQIIQNDCRQGFPDEYPAPGIQCDEYPFNATYQNAASVGEGSNLSYSVRPITGSHNQSAGGILSAMFRDSLVIDGDRFWVDVVAE